MIGWALAGVVNTVNPQVIVIGGGVANAGSVLTDAIARVVRRHAMKQIKQHVRVKKALLGNDAGVIGAALLVKS
jgi:glucokinase